MKYQLFCSVLNLLYDIFATILLWTDLSGSPCLFLVWDAQADFEDVVFLRDKDVLVAWIVLRLVIMQHSRAIGELKKHRVALVNPLREAPSFIYYTFLFARILFLTLRRAGE